MLVLESDSALITVYGPLCSSSHTTVNKTLHAEAESPTSAFLLIIFLPSVAFFLFPFTFDDFTRALSRNIMRKVCGTTHDGIGCY